MTTTNNQLTFWQRPEGTTGKVIIGVAGVAAAGVLYKVLPFLITLAENVIYLSVLIGVIGALYMIVTSDRVRTLIFYAFQALSRAITSNFVNIDPVGILRSFVKDMKKKRETVQEAITSMMGVRQKSEQAKTRMEREMKDAFRLAEAAEQTGNEEKVNELAERVARRQRGMESLEQNIAFATETIEALSRVDRVIEYHINNSEDEMNQLAHNNELAIQMLAATHAASQALGDTDMLEVRNMAADVIRDRVAKATGEVESLLQSTRSVQGEIDLNRLALRADGRAKLAQLRNQIDSAETDAKPRMITTGAARQIETKSNNRWAQHIKRQ